jgi:hypothetical protein
LLQHDFRDPDEIRVARFAPGEVSLMLRIPDQDLVSDGMIRHANILERYECFIHNRKTAKKKGSMGV